ncbi:unnamed protein product [Acanthoscelides obtectus]|uniref:Uncharacterized protein n=1 Tax=Acanthoscelides obtectus TaxID=200917 RepID=A0A9P0MDV2_ACAOB|nr:unnamed protein product [Acanthoscelides obtectus]CAK1623985.1 hypothetical protein AOBTE_LOCUS2266 [Acanthoscelides obtectus]
MRDQQLAVRIKAAKDRKRMRLGLPPEEDEPRKPQKPCESEEEKEKREEEQKERETAEKKLEKLRKKHVRPWDIGKEGVTIFEEMAQDEWLEKKRDERPHEFAPPQTYTKRQNFRSTVKKEAVQGGYKKEGLKFSTIKNSKNYNKAKNKMSDFEKIPLSQPILSTPVQDEPCGDFDNALLEDCRKFSNQIKSNVYNAEANYGASETKRGRLAENNNDFQNNILADYRRSMEQSDPNVHSFGASPDFEYVIMTHPPKTMSGGIKIGESPPPYFKRGNDRSDFEDALMVHPKKSVAGTHHNKINFGESRSFFKRESDRDHFEDTIMTEKVASLSSRNVEIPSSDFEDPLLADYRSRSSQNDRGNSIEVPPPPTFNYYGPSRRGTKEKVAKLGGDEIEKSIEAGLKLLRKQVEEKEKSKGRPDEIFLL